MKDFIAVVCFTLLLTIGLLPAMAQRPADTPLRGRIVEVNGRTVQIAWHYLAANKNEPGTVPEDIARQIATLRGLAERLQKQGKPADKLLQHAERLQCWREVKQPITDWAGIDLVGLRSKPLVDIRADMKVRLMVEVKNARGNGLPAQGVLVSDVEQVDGDARTGHRRLPGENNSTLFEVTGEVKGTRPLVIEVGGAKIQVETADRYKFIERQTLAARELRARTPRTCFCQLWPKLTLPVYMTRF